MLAFIQQNSDLLQVAISLLTALIWLAYLQMLLSSFLRQRRSKIMINLGAGVGLKARCFVSNLGFEPIYLLEVHLRLISDEEDWTSAITDRDELTTEQLTNPRDATNQGPLKSGESTDIGSVEDLIARARRQHPRNVDPASLTRAILTVVATSAASTAVVGAERAYALRPDSRDRTRMTADGIAARQIRSRRERRKLRRALQRRL